MESIDGIAFGKALASGIHRVIGVQEHLNRINVFPVADSDTGTNLSLSLGSALQVLNNSTEKHVGDLLVRVADALLDGARGNSGAIMAQFFQGVSDAAGDVREFTAESFAAAMASGNEYAHDALSQPREGTILSVVAAFANSLREGPADELATRLRRAVDATRRALDDTPKQLDVLRKAGVVDAGAKGFAEMVDGMVDFLESGKFTPMPDVALSEAFEDPIEFAAEDNVSQYRFCTECLVTGDDIDRRKLREALAPLGDSFVLAGSKRKAKIHIHVDEPEAVFEAARAFGDVHGEKADDTHLQQHATHEGKQKFAVITDSAADILDEDIERLDIHMVPCRIQFGERGYLDKVSITTEEFYSELETNPNHPTTSQPAPGDFRRQYQFLASHFPDVLSINLTSAASGTWQAAVSAASRTRAKGRVHVIDSLTASVGQGQLVVLAAECAAAGLDIEATKRIVESQVPSARIFALLNNLEYAVRGGRLPNWVRRFANLLNLTPIIRIARKGNVTLGGFLFGQRNRVDRFARLVAHRLGTQGDVELVVGHALAPEKAVELQNALQRRIPHATSIKTCDLGTALGVHGGPGTLIVSSLPVMSAQDFAVGDD